MSERVFICSPLAGNIPLHTAYARECLRDSLFRGEYPFVPHLLYPQVLDDQDPSQRKLALIAGAHWLAKSQKLLVYEDLGISQGMRGEIQVANDLSIPIERRRIGAAFDRSLVD